MLKGYTYFTYYRYVFTSIVKICNKNLDLNLKICFQLKEK